MTLDAEAQELCLCAVSGAYADFFPSTYRQSVDVGLVGAAVRTGKTIVVEDVSRDSRFYFPPALAGSVGSEISIPLKAGAEVLGVLDIHAPKVSAFDACDVDAMEALANQMAIALNNARLCARAKDEAVVKAALLRELSHRVKNNLTAITGLLYLGLDDDHIPREQVLSETLGRVQGLAIAHTLLAETSQARVDLLDLSRRIVSDAVHRMTLPGQVFPFTVQGPSVEISARQASSLALVLNELVTNAVKHGDRTPNPTCSLCIERLDGKTQLTLVNPGRLPEGFTLDGPSSGLGLKLVRTLVEKDLRGQFALSSSKGAVTGVVRFTPER
jgi:two-component sensor histidine kinase